MSMGISHATHNDDFEVLQCQYVQTSVQIGYFLDKLISFIVPQNIGLSNRSPTIFVELSLIGWILN